jgi:hypothetical protein
LYWSELPVHPWAYWKPSPTGAWQGDARVGDTRLRLVLSLTHVDKSFFAAGNGPDILGQAVLCDSTGRVQSYKIEGQIDYEQGWIAMILVHPLPSQIPTFRVDRVIVLRWDGGSTVRAYAPLQRVAEGGDGRTSPPNPRTGPPTPFLLRPNVSGQACTAS